MKNKVLLIITFILSFVIYTNTVDAATELTCVYKKISNQAAIKIVQYKDGTKKAALNTNLKEEQPAFDSDTWTLGVDIVFDNNEELTSCPNYVDLKGYNPRKIYFSATAKSQYAELSNSKNEIDDKWKSDYDSYYVPGEKSNMEDELSSGKWIKGCQYKKLNENSYIYLYFNESQVRVVKEDEVLPNDTSAVLNGLLEYSDIQVSRVLKEYENYGGCPINIYKNEIHSGIKEGSTIYSLDRLASGSYMTTYVYMGGSDNDDPIPTDPEDCSQLLGDDVINFINEIMKWIRIFIPILLIGLGILDFTKATFSKTEEDMKKAREKFIKRIIAAVLVFLVPIFVNLLLDLANSVWSWINPETCIK